MRRGGRRARSGRGGGRVARAQRVGGGRGGRRVPSVLAPRRRARATLRPALQPRHARARAAGREASLRKGKPLKVACRPMNCRGGQILMQI